MQTRNYFADLNIEPTNDYYVIRSAYHARMLAVHPDKAGESEATVEAAKAANEAWEYLQDETNRTTLIAQLSFTHSTASSSSTTQSRAPSQKPTEVRSTGPSVTLYVPCWIFEGSKDPAYPLHEFGIYADEAADISTNPQFIYALFAKRMNDLLNREDSHLFAGADIEDALKIIDLHSWYKYRAKVTQYILKMVVPLSTISSNKATEASFLPEDYVANSNDAFFVLTRSTASITAYNIVSAHLTGQWNGLGRSETESRVISVAPDRNSTNNSSLVPANNAGTNKEEESKLRQHAENNQHLAKAHKGLADIPSVMQNQNQDQTPALEYPQTKTSAPTADKTDVKYSALVKAVALQCQKYLDDLKKSNKPTAEVKRLLDILQDNDPTLSKTKYNRFIKAFNEFQSLERISKDNGLNNFFANVKAAIDSAEKDYQANPLKYVLISTEDGKKNFEKFDVLFANLLTILPPKWQEYVNATTAENKHRLYADLMTEKDKRNVTVNSVLLMLCNDMSGVKDKLNGILTIEEAIDTLINTAVTCKKQLEEIPKSTFSSLFGNAAKAQAEEIGRVLSTQRERQLRV